MKVKAKKFLIISLSALFLFSFFSFFNFAFSQERGLEVEYPDIPGAPLTPKTVATPLPDYVRYIFNFSIIIFGLIVLGVLVFGGVKYLLSVGKPAVLAEAKSQIIAAFLGLIFLLSSYLILVTINPNLAIFEISELIREPLFSCQDDASCDGRPGCETPGSCRCDAGICRAKYETQEISLIAYEIPLGQMIEKGVWSEPNVNKATGLLDNFEGFLKKEISVNPTFNRISDLNKYLVSLTEDCRCGAMEAVCASPEAGAGGVGCFGDPCKDSKEEIQKIVDINTQKIKELDDFKRKIEEQYEFSLQEYNKYFNASEELRECIERGSMLTLGDYLSTAQFFNDQGWKTKVEKNKYFPEGRAHPLTFYCIKGGTVFDAPVSYASQIPDIPPELSEISTPIATQGELFCPVVLPIGELFDDIGSETLRVTERLDALLSSIEDLSTELQTMLDLTAQCRREDACTINCARGPNPCFPGQGACVPIPFSISEICCSPLSIPTCLVCTPGVNNLSPNLQAKGTCQGNPNAPYHGSPCPRDKINESLKMIKFFDEEIIENIKTIKEGFIAKPYIAQTPEGEGNILEGLKAGTSWCISDDIENPTRFLLNCLSALGSTGPDGNIIANCNPQSFFCCTPDKSEADKAPRQNRELASYSRPIEPVNLSGECSVDYKFTEVAPCGWVRAPNDQDSALYHITNYYSKRIREKNERRWARPEFISLVMAVATQMYNDYGKNLYAGDWTGRCKPAGDPHKDHNTGYDVDISVRHLTTGQRIALAQKFISCGVTTIGYTGAGGNLKEGGAVRQTVNSWAQQQGYKGRISPWKGHGHFHVRLK